MILIIIASDLAAVFPDYTDTFEIDLKESLRILERYPVPDKIRNTDTGDIFVFKVNVKGHYHLDDAVKFRMGAENSRCIPNTGNMYAYRIRMNTSILKE